MESSCDWRFYDPRKRRAVDKEEHTPDTPPSLVLNYCLRSRSGGKTEQGQGIWGKEVTPSKSALQYKSITGSQKPYEMYIVR